MIQGQTIFKKSLKSYDEKLISKIIEAISGHEEYKNLYVKKLHNLSAPYFSYRLYTIEDAKKNVSLEALQPDSLFKKMSYDLIIQDDSIYCYPSTLGKSNILISFVESDSSMMESSQLIKMIQTAKKHSENIFYLNVLQRIAVVLDVIAFCEDGQIKCIDRTLRIYSSIREYILSQLGSMEKYVELCHEDSLRSATLKNMNIEDCKKVFQNDYRYWEKYLPSDTATILRLFLSELSSFAGLSEIQSNLLANKINEDMKSKVAKSNCYCDISLLGRDVSYTVIMILTQEQLIRYKWKLSLRNWIRARSMERLDDYYLHERKIPIEKEDEIFRKEVYPHK